MNDFIIGTVSLLSSNVLLSSYPILIKKYIENVDVVTQLIIRCIIYIFLAIPFMLLGNDGGNILGYLVQPKYLFISFINLIHIYTSYKGFELLNPGIALTTFYTYPIIQLFLSRFILGFKFNTIVISNLLGSLLGLVILNIDIFNEKKTMVWYGFIFIAFAALTEAIINIFYKKVNLINPFSSLYTLYAPAFILFFIYLVFNKIELKKIKSIDTSIIKKIVLFNLLIGGLGYTLRLFSLTKVNMTWFSTLSFTNGISVFLLAWLILGDKIKIHHIIGSAIIFYNITKIKNLM